MCRGNDQRLPEITRHPDRLAQMTFGRSVVTDLSKHGPEGHSCANLSGAVPVSLVRSTCCFQSRRGEGELTAPVVHHSPVLNCPAAVGSRAASARRRRGATALHRDRPGGRRRPPASSSVRRRATRRQRRPPLRFLRAAPQQQHRDDRVRVRRFRSPTARVPAPPRRPDPTAGDGSPRHEHRTGQLRRDHGAP